MNVIQTKLPGVLIIEPKVFGDARGFFLETYNKSTYMAQGFPDVSFVQDNHSRSGKGILRGMHTQILRPQGKLVQVVTGAVFDVAVDIRQGSPTFGHWVGYELNEDNHRQLWVPSGFAHGFCTLSEKVDFVYKCTDFYDASDESGFAWDDADVGIDWPVTAPLLSEKDKALPRLADVPPGKLPVL